MKILKLWYTKANGELTDAEITANGITGSMTDFEKAFKAGRFCDVLWGTYEHDDEGGFTTIESLNERGFNYKNEGTNTRT